LTIFFPCIFCDFCQFSGENGVFSQTPML
jgi:hypothetical protein